MLGHGRALEAYLIGAKMLMGMIILAPSIKVQMLPLSDLLWMPDWWLSAPFLAIGMTQMIGLTLNINGVRSSWMWRSTGASAGICLWTWLITKTIAIGAIGAGSLPFWVMSLVASTFLLWRGINRLPHPGAPGAPL